MASLSKDFTISDYQSFVRDVYGKSNDLHFGTYDMFNNVQRFAMRSLKGIRKGNKERTKLNLFISLSWFASLLNRLHLDLEGITWQRFPYKCSYCNSQPCACKAQKVQSRQPITVDDSKRPKTFKEFQEMFEAIYPSNTRTLEHAGVHLAEEVGEFSEAFMAFKGSHKDSDFKNLSDEAADVFSCLLGVCNSYGIDLSEELSSAFNNGCHACHRTPCECDFEGVISYKS